MGVLGERHRSGQAADSTVPLVPILTAARDPSVRGRGPMEPKTSQTPIDHRCGSAARLYLPDLNSQRLLHVNGTLSAGSVNPVRSTGLPSCLSEIHYQVGIRQRLVYCAAHAQRIMNNENSMDWRQTQLTGGGCWSHPFTQLSCDTPSSWKPFHSSQQAVSGQPIGGGGLWALPHSLSTLLSWPAFLLDSYVQQR